MADFRMPIPGRFRKVRSKVVEDLMDLAGSELQVGAQRANVLGGGHYRPVNGEKYAGKADAPKIGWQASGHYGYACILMFTFGL